MNKGPNAKATQSLLDNKRLENRLEQLEEENNLLKIKLAENVSANDEQSERIIDLESKIKSLESRLEYNNDTCELKTYILLEIPFNLFYNY